MPKLTVDGVTVEVPAGATVLQACEAAGREIPRFCYHERLSIAGNCRMCLVEQEKAPKPIASCAMPAAENMVIHTDTPKVKKAREGVMEFLLINHPLDCPICDQGGECDLQDQAVGYGRGHTRFDENKRAVTEKYMGPLIKTVMTRCIHCTRCVRFAEEVAGVEEIGAIGRGENMQITTYLEKAVTSELSGNVIDLCPVGALTSKPYAFEARAWELKHTDTVDVMDAVGTNIRVDARGPQVMRVLPLVNDDVNDEWAADKTRFAVDGLSRRRLDRPWVRDAGGKLRAASWPEAFAAVARGLDGLSGDAVGYIAGDLLAVEDMVAWRDLLGVLGSTRAECRQDGALLDPAQGRASYLLNSTIAGLETADAVLLVGSNPRWEAPLVNTRLRKAVRRGAKVWAIGDPVDLTYPAEWIGDDIGLLARLPEAVGQALAAAARPAVLVGMGAAAMPGALAAAAALGLQREGWNGYNLLHTAAARGGGLDLGLVTQGGVAAMARDAASGALKALILHGADEVDTATLKGPFTIYVGTHGDAGVRVADVILPAAAYTEKSGTFVNTEGRVQRGRRAVFPPGEARADWSIARALSAVLGRALPYDDEAALARRIAAEWPGLAREGRVPATWVAPTGPALGHGAIAYPIQDYYWTNPVARASKTMMDCRVEILGEGLAQAAE